MKVRLYWGYTREEKFKALWVILNKAIKGDNYLYVTETYIDNKKKRNHIKPKQENTFDYLTFRITDGAGHYSFRYKECMDKLISIEFRGTIHVFNN